MTEPVKTVIFGGVTFNANDVASKSKEKDKFGNDIFTVVFKTGEKLTYPEHDENLGPTVNLQREKGFVYDDTKFDMSYIFGATFTSSPKTVASVNLDNSYKCTIDLSANKSIYYGDNVKINGGVWNKVIMDGKDTAIINGKQVKGSGTVYQ